MQADVVTVVSARAEVTAASVRHALERGKCLWQGPRASWQPALHSNTKQLGWRRFKYRRDFVDLLFPSLPSLGSFFQLFFLCYSVFLHPVLHAAKPSVENEIGTLAGQTEEALQHILMLTQAIRNHKIDNNGEIYSNQLYSEMFD